MWIVSVKRNDEAMEAIRTSVESEMNVNSERPGVYPPFQKKSESKALRTNRGGEWLPSPYEALYKVKPRIDHMRTYGCLSHV
jgi:hypothetical protein